MEAKLGCDGLGALIHEAFSPRAELDEVPLQSTYPVPREAPKPLVCLSGTKNISVSLQV
jgi:hypothetical protein